MVLLKTNKRMLLLIAFTVVVVGTVLFATIKYSNPAVSPNKKIVSTTQVKSSNSGKVVTPTQVRSSNVGNSETPTRVKSSNVEKRKTPAQVSMDAPVNGTTLAANAGTVSYTSVQEKAAKKAKSIGAKRKSLEDRQKYIEALSGENLKIVAVSGDGNCMFRSLAYALYDGDDSRHAEVRKTIVDHMRDEVNGFSSWKFNMFREENEDLVHFKKFKEKEEKEEVGENEFQLYLRYMGTLGVWGGNLELVAASKVFERTIDVYRYNPLNEWLSVHSIGHTNDETIQLSYSGKIHYDAIVKIIH